MCYYNGIYFRATDGVKAKNREGDTVLVPTCITLRECIECGELFIDDGGYTVDADGYIVCEQCDYDYSYYICDVSGGWARGENVVTLYSTSSGREIGYACENCVDQRRVRRCECCGHYIENSGIYCTADEYNLCEYCYNNETNYCDECNERFYGECAGDYDEDDDVWLCNDCMEARDTATIHKYSYKPEPEFKKTENEVCQKEYFGFEIEVAGAEHKAESFLSEIPNQEDIYLKHDGSVCGFEIVTHPMSRLYFYEKFMPGFEQGLKYLRLNNFKGHNYGGIHIHVSRTAISEDMLKKMVMLLYPKSQKVKRKWLAITQRREDELNRWSSMSEESIYGKKKTIEKINVIKERNEKNAWIENVYFNSARYTAINTANDNTYEFRIFNSNIRPERIIKNAEVIFSLIDFCATEQLPTMGNYLRFIRKNKDTYKSLYDFLLEKRLIQTDEQKEKTDKLKEVIKEMEGEPIDQRNIQEYIQGLNILPDFSEQVDDRETISRV